MVREHCEGNSMFDSIYAVCIQRTWLQDKNIVADGIYNVNSLGKRAIVPSWWSDQSLIFD